MKKKISLFITIFLSSVVVVLFAQEVINVSSAGIIFFNGPIRIKGGYRIFDESKNTHYDLLPVGTIIMYDGKNWVDNTTLKGWYACTANNVARGCPNLTDKFIRGAGSAADVGGYGGYASISKTLTPANLPAHNHYMQHSHNLGANGSYGTNISFTRHGPGYSNSGSVSFAVGYSTYTGYGGSTTGRVYDTYSMAVQTYSGYTSNTGTGTSFSIDTVPPYYVVIFVRKCE
jgi:hypothetical protein